MRPGLLILLLTSGIRLLLGQEGLYATDAASQTAPLAISPVTSTNEISGMNSEHLLQSLNLNFPGLEKTKKAFAHKDVVGANRELAAYYRNRKAPLWRTDGKPDKASAQNIRIADAAADGRVVGGLVAVEHSFPDGNIDWMFNATEKRSNMAYNPEWQLQLNRMYFWTDIRKAYLSTGDEKYARAFASQVQDWIRDCPVPSQIKNRAPSTWRTIEAGLRMAISWPDAYSTFLHSPSLDDETLLAMLGSFLDHARYLRANPTTGNWLALEMAGLYTVGALFPEFSESSDWREFSSSKLGAEVQRQFLPDGGQIELTPGYHNAAVDSVLMILDAAHLTSRDAELPATYRQALERAFDFNLCLMTPDRNLPRFNDSWPVPADVIFRKATRFFPERKDFAWALDAGGKESPPSFTSRFLNWSGYAVMRSGWSPVSNYLVFDVGPLGFAHVHQDKLNVVLWAHGREMLFDSGGASYERSKWRDWSLSTAAHNCVLVDGQGQNVSYPGEMENRYTDSACVSQKPIEADWQSTKVFDYAWGSYDAGWGPGREKIASHERKVLFLKPDLFLVADLLTPTDDKKHLYDARWHLLTTETSRDENDGVVSRDPNVPNLLVLPLLPDGLKVTADSRKETPEILGWNTRKDHVPPLLPATTIQHIRQGSGSQQFLTLLFPLKTGEANPVASVSGGTEPTIHFKDGRQVKISTQEGFRVSELLADGQPGRSAVIPAIPSSSPKP